MSAYISDDDGASSPDPLAISANQPSTKHLRKASRRTSAPLGKRSENMQYVNTTSATPSPTKSITLSTPKAAGTSPWKIKVTVEAEPQFDASDTENAGSPTKTRRMRTMTTTVPLKGPDESSPVKRRGRPRKSDGAAATKGKRSGTPVKRRTRASRKSEVEEEESTSAPEQEATAPPKKGRGRPRKSSEAAEIQEPAHLPQAREVPGLGELTRAAYESESSAEPPDEFPAQERMEEVAETSAPEAVHQAQQRKVFDFTNLTPLHHKHVLPSPKPAPPETPKVKPPYAKSIKLRKATPPRPTSKASAGYLPFTPSPDKQLPDVTPHTDKFLPLEPRPYLPAGSSKRSCPTWKEPNPLRYDQSGTSLPEGSPLKRDKPSTPLVRHETSASLEPRGSSKHPPCSVPPTSTDEDDEPEMSEDDYNDFENLHAGNQAVAGAEANDTILQSEEFSMISIDSLPSRQAMLSSPSDSRTPQRDEYVVVRGDIDYLSPRSLAGPSAVEIEADQMASGDNTPLYINSSYLQLSQPDDSSPAQISPTPSQPPLRLTNTASQKTSTPKLAKVIRTGIALQGVFNTNALSSPSRSSGEQKIRLDNLFSGFGEGTQRELRAGLRLGEQLAERSQQRRKPSILTPIPSQASPTGNMSGEVPHFRNEPAEVSYPRLPTPEEEDNDMSLPAQPNTSIHSGFESLNAKMMQAQLISPARSAISDAMSWQPSTPPSTKSNTSASQAEESPLNQQKVATGGQRNPDIPALAKEEIQVTRKRRALHRQPKAVPKPTPAAEDIATRTEEDYEDLWEEEASRSSDLQQKEQSPQFKDLFGDEPVRPRRSKLPKTWRRKSASNFQYSDEAEPEPENSSPAVEAIEQSTNHRTVTVPLKEAHNMPAEEQSATTSDSEMLTPRTDQDDGEETGIFWQQSSPATSHKNPAMALNNELKATKLDLSMLLDIHGTPLQLSPPKNPRRFSPAKPLVLEHTATVATSAGEEQPGNSVDGTSLEEAYEEEAVEDTMASDVRQLHAEMTHSAPPSKPWSAASQARRLVYEITTDIQPPQSSISRSSAYASELASEITSTTTTVSATTASTAASAPLPTRAPSLLTRLTSALWSTRLYAPEPAAPHPLTLSHHPLPLAQPWTKSHYRTLDALYQSLKRTPHLFSPDLPANAALLQDPNHRPRLAAYVGTRFGNWGYTATVTEEWMVLVGAYLQLLTLPDAGAYATIAGKVLDFGPTVEVNREGVKMRVLEVMAGWPGEDGEAIGPETVVRRLWSVVCGEMVRRDERRGRVVRRTPGTFWVEWPTGG
ncbi:hypothetical protein H2201_002133 [Coniosporium apollinis]|uniref:Uncharacterized protein n=1 Tax=Coniosporium apollinis TaxID=61459 RepID=A0ABQ9P420_9PEZI|nr:hypothetical protein H2201_002133 [Coniosporium apollinis]